MSELNLSEASPYRPLPLRCKADLQISKHVYCGQNYWVVGDPISLEFYRFNEQEYALLSWCDGQRSLDEIKELFEERFAPYRIKHKEIQSFLIDLYQKALLVSGEFDQGRHLYQIGKKKKLKKAAKQASNVLAIRWKGINPDGLLEIIEPYTSWFFSKPMVGVVITIMISALALVCTQYQEFAARLPSIDEFFGPHNWLGLVLVIAGTKVIHELAHGVACKRYGGVCHELGVMFLVFIPTLFVNTSDSWRIESKWKRATIGAAGIYVELFMASIATFLWWFLVSPGPLEYILLNIMVLSTVSTILFNGNPLLRFDGYFVLADLLEIPNLGERSGKLIRNWFLTGGLGVRETDEYRTPWETKVWLASYNILSFLYKVFIVYLIAFVVVKIFRPFGLEQLSIMFSIGVMIALLLVPVFMLGKYFWIPGRKERIKKHRLIGTSFVLATLVAFITVVPLPDYVRCSFSIEPNQSATIYANHDAFVEQLDVSPGQYVSQGEVIGRLKNIELNLQQEKLTGRIAEVKSELKSLNRIRSSQPDTLIEKSRLQAELVKLDKKLAELKRQLDSLVLVAPADGKLIAKWVDKSPEDETSELKDWHGETLRQEASRMMFERGQAICSVGDVDQLRARLIIPQADIKEIGEGQEVRMMLDAKTDRILLGTIESIAVKNVDSLDLRHALVFGGSVEAKPADSEQSRMNSELQVKSTRPVYQGVVKFDRLKNVSIGQKGNARIFIGYRTLASKFTRFMMKTFRFEI